jgi:hypothetical protein
MTLIPPPVPLGADPRLPVHAESLRAGIRVCFQALKRVMPTPDVVEQIVATESGHVSLREFPITQVMAQGPERRRMYAFKAMECLLVRSGQESLLMSNDQLDKLVDMAWHIAGVMETQDQTAMQLDTLRKT